MGLRDWVRSWARRRVRGAKKLAFSRFINFLSYMWFVNVDRFERKGRRGGRDCSTGRGSESAQCGVFVDLYIAGSSGMITPGWR